MQQFLDCLEVAVPAAVKEWDQADGFGRGDGDELGDFGGGGGHGLVHDYVFAGFEDLAGYREVGSAGGGYDE